jgi:hypothetical protein
VPGESGNKLISSDASPTAFVPPCRREELVRENVDERLPEESRKVLAFLASFSSFISARAVAVGALAARKQLLIAYLFPASGDRLQSSPFGTTQEAGRSCRYDTGSR